MALHLIFRFNNLELGLFTQKANNILCCIFYDCISERNKPQPTTSTYLTILERELLRKRQGSTLTPEAGAQTGSAPEGEPQTLPINIFLKSWYLAMNSFQVALEYVSELLFQAGQLGGTHHLF